MLQASWPCWQSVDVFILHISCRLGEFSEGDTRNLEGRIPSTKNPDKNHWIRFSLDIFPIKNSELGLGEVFLFVGLRYTNWNFSDWRSQDKKEEDKHRPHLS